MDVKPGDTCYAPFTTQASTGAATNADSTPTGKLNRNGTDDAGVTVTVTNLDTGRYIASFTVPTTYVPGDVLNLYISATVSSVAGKAPVWHAKVGWGFVASGTATAGGTNTITLQTALGADHKSRRHTIAIVSGTGSGQARNITDYVNSTKVVTVDRNWTTAPDLTSVYVIFFNDTDWHDDVGGVNVTQYAGQTAAVGSDNLPKVGLWSILGTALSETVGGYLAAAFKKFFNIATPTSTMNEITLVDTVTTVTGGATSAVQTSILNAVNAITTNTARTGITVPQFVPLPASGTSTVRVKIKLFDLQGALEDADTNTVTVHAADHAGTSLDAKLSATTATRDSAGQYHVDYTVSSTDAEGGVYIAVTYTVGGVSMAADAVFAVAQADTVTSIASILSTVNTINTNVGTAGAGLTNVGDARLAHLDANVSSRAAPGAQMDLVNAPNATAIAAIQNGLSKPATPQTIDQTTALPTTPVSGSIGEALKRADTNSGGGGGSAGAVGMF